MDKTLKNLLEDLKQCKERAELAAKDYIGNAKDIKRQAELKIEFDPNYTKGRYLDDLLFAQRTETKGVQEWNFHNILAELIKKYEH